MLGTQMTTMHNPCWFASLSLITTSVFSFAYSKAPWPLSPDNPISQMLFCFGSRFALPVRPADLQIPDAERKALDSVSVQGWYSLKCRWHVRYLWEASVLGRKQAKTKSLGKNGLLVEGRQEGTEANGYWLVVPRYSSGAETGNHSPGTSGVVAPWEEGWFVWRIWEGDLGFGERISWRIEWYPQGV